MVLTSDRGLCGSFNSNILRQTEEYIVKHKSEHEDISIIALSKRADDYFKKHHINVIKYYESVLANVTYQSALNISEDIINLFLNNELDEIYIAYTQFKSAISYDPVLIKLLPLVPRPANKDENVVDYIFEPSADEILEQLLRKHIVTQISRAMLASVASEHGARMTVMEAATNNASEMIRSFTLLYNRARQAAITKELVEIVSGAEALKTKKATKKSEG